MWKAPRFETTEDDQPERTVLQPMAPPQPGSLTQVFESGRPCSKPAIGLGDLDAVTLGRASSSRSGRLTSIGGERRLTVEIDDRRMSVVHAHLRRVPGGWSVEDAHSKNGTRVNGCSIERAVLTSGDLVEAGRSFFVYREHVPYPVRAAGSEPGLATHCAGLARQLERLAAVARSSIAVVVEGDTGTGKELIARAVHQISGRTGPLVALNCGALSRTLLESELFGYRRGAFSGATEDRPGLIRSADQGTLFLDEIADLPLDGQAALLRVLQEGEVMPVGGVKPVPVDLRIVAATHRPLASMVVRETFRADLLARLTGFRIALPPLCERREDLGALLRSLLGRREAPSTVELTAGAIRALHRYSWPGNIRELDKVLTTALVLAGGQPIALDHLPESVRAAAVPSPTAPAQVSLTTTDECTPSGRDRLEGLLAQHQGNINAVARELRTSRTQVHRLCLRFGIDARSHRDGRL